MKRIWRKVRARLALLPEAAAVRRAGGRGFVGQACDLVRLRLGPTRLRAAEYYDFRLWDRRLSMVDKRAFSGDWHKNQVHRRLNNRGWEVLMTDKLAECAMFRALGIPHAAVHAIATAEPRLFGEIPCFTKIEPLAEFVRREIPYPFFIKPVKGQEGRCCFSVRGYDAARDSLRFGDGSLVPVRDFLAGLTDPTGFGMMFLEHLESHPCVRDLCGDAVSSVRMIVLLGDDGPTLFHADWGLPSGRSMISNFAKGETGNMIGGLDLETGRVTRVLAGTGRDRVDVDLHPLNSRPMIGFQLPDWHEAVALCLKAATGYPGARWQNWDIGLTSRGPVALELNSSGDLYAVQYITGTGAVRGKLAEFLQRHRFRDDAPRRLFAPK